MGRPWGGPKKRDLGEAFLRVLTTFSLLFMVCGWRRERRGRFSANPKLGVLAASERRRRRRLS